MDSDSSGILTSFNESMALCCKLIEAGDYSSSKQSISDLVDILGSQDSQDESVCLEILTEIHRYIASPSLLKQEVIDELAFELPKAVARFACLSNRCLELAEKVVQQFVERCSPRDMLSILCEALSSPPEEFGVPVYYIPLLGGISKVLILIQRRQYEQVKVAIPIIIDVLKTMSSELVYEDTYYENLFQKAIDVANSVKAICGKLDSEECDKLRALLGLYILQITALVSIIVSSEQCLPLVLELSDLLQHCQLSYIGLITGHGVNIIQNLVLKNDNDDIMDSFSEVRLGAILEVIWGYMVSEVAKVAKADFSNVIKELQCNWTRRWEAISMLRYIWSCVNLPWKLKKKAIEFLLHILDGIVPLLDDNSVDHSIDITTMYTSLKAIFTIIMCASESESRKDAFGAFKKVLADVPPSVRLDVLRALVVNSDSSSMVAILLDCVKEQMRMGIVNETSSSDANLNNKVTLCASFWNPSALELVEFILRPPRGGPPSLPEYSDAILSALNLYRFIFLTESSTGKSNLTGIFSKDKLQKAYNGWFLPLRTLLMRASQNNDDSEIVTDIMFALNLVKMVLYRCIELVENELMIWLTVAKDSEFTIGKTMEKKIFGD